MMPVAFSRKKCIYLEWYVRYNKSTFRRWVCTNYKHADVHESYKEPRSPFFREIPHWRFARWMWAYHAVPKRLATITQWHGAISQKTEKSTAAPQRKSKKSHCTELLQSPLLLLLLLQSPLLLLLLLLVQCFVLRVSVLFLCCICFCSGL
jgi:hypothetical protein